MLVKFSSLAGGVFIEVKGDTESPHGEYSADARCFRFDALGNAEYTRRSDLMDSPSFARWFGFALKERDFVFA